MAEQHNNIHYVDCLTMFCTEESAKVPGAVLGGRAKAEYKYFEGDRLHLSVHGYQIWKKVVEDIVENQILANKVGKST